ncbi:MAG: hypothetical protein LUD48_00225 [Prevotella sp.]|nr:hypothetical protein [Prevotella sp.]
MKTWIAYKTGATKTEDIDKATKEFVLQYLLSGSKVTKSEIWSFDKSGKSGSGSTTGKGELDNIKWKSPYFLLTGQTGQQSATVVPGGVGGFNTQVHYSTFTDKSGNLLNGLSTLATALTGEYGYIADKYNISMGGKRIDSVNAEGVLLDGA